MTREELEQAHGEVWDTGEATKKFSFESFLAPIAFVIDRETGQSGTIEFQHRPRFYFSFKRSS